MSIIDAIFGKKVWLYWTDANLHCTEARESRAKPHPAWHGHYKEEHGRTLCPDGSVYGYKTLRWVWADGRSQCPSCSEKEKS